jgi:hypothetical protein
MAKNKPLAPGWGDCKKALSSWPRAGIVALLKELYDLNSDNKMFLQSRLLPDEGLRAALDMAKCKVRSMVNYARMIKGGFRHSEVKRLVDQFEKGCSDPTALAELLLVDLNAASEALEQIGDYVELVDHLYVMLGRLHKTLERVSGDQLRALVGQLIEFANRFGDRFGYGISDEFVGTAEFWAQKIAASQHEADSDGTSDADARQRPDPEW